MSRIASSIVSGIGFLGAGMIIKDGKSIRGLNTAATLWCVAAIGLLSSTGMIWEAIIGTLYVLISNVILRVIALFLMKKIENTYKEVCKIYITCQSDVEVIVRSYASFARAEQTQNNPQSKQIAMVQAMINMANISDDLTADVQDLIEEQVAQTELTPAQQIALLENMGTEYSFDVDYDVLACDPDYARKALKGMISVMNATGKKTMAEKMYLSMASKTLGISKEELDEMMK